MVMQCNIVSLVQTTAGLLNWQVCKIVGMHNKHALYISQHIKRIKDGMCLWDPFDVSEI